MTQLHRPHQHLIEYTKPHGFTRLHGAQLDQPVDPCLYSLSLGSKNTNTSLQVPPRDLAPNRLRVVAAFGVSA